MASSFDPVVTSAGATQRAPLGVAMCTSRDGDRLGRLMVADVGVFGDRLDDAHPSFDEPDRRVVGDPVAGW